MSSKIKLFPHQEESLKLTKGKNKVAYYLDMGLGKTYVGSEKLKELGANKNLIIVQRSKVDDWVKHFKDNYNYQVYNLRKKKELTEFIETDKESVGVINYDLTWRRNDLLKLKGITIMLDESTYIKNNTAKRTKFIMKLDYKNVILLSGTPVSGKYEEIWTQIRLLGWNITKREFYRRYIITRRIDVGGFPIDLVIGYKNIDELKANLAKYGAVFMKTEEVMELPDQVKTVINVDSTPEYRKFKKNRYVDLGDEELIGDYTLTQMLGERQLCGIHNKNKHTAFKDLLDSTQDRIIVFYNFTREYTTLKELVPKDRPISVVNGSERNLNAYEDNDNSITFIQYQAGSQGLNLQKANKLVYYSPPTSVEHYMQSHKRIHRIGQEKTCFYYYLKSKNSIETKIYQALERGEDYTNKLFEK